MNYSFEDNSIDPSPRDFSGNGNNMEGYGQVNESPLIVTNDAAAGIYSVGFNHDGYFQLPNGPLVPALAGSFSISLWLKTTQTSGNDDDPGVYDGNPGLISAMGLSGGVRVSLTGSKLAFVTGGSSVETLHSVASVNSGQWLHVAVTRNQSTGEKRIYINGVLDASDSGTTNTLAPPGVQLCEPYPQGYSGELDEIQIYSGILSASEVSFIYQNPGKTVANISASGLLAHFRGDDSANPGRDSSANHYDLNFIGDWNNGSAGFSATAIDGSGALAFHRNSTNSNSGGYCGWNPATPAALLSALAHNFSISLWVKTSDTSNAGIISADVPGNAPDLIPVALTGPKGQVTFTTGGDDGDDVVYGVTPINDDGWHHVVVTRSQVTGEKRVYIDGALNNSDYSGYGGHFGPTNVLSAPQKLTFGALADASNPDANDPTYHNGYDGLLDDVQIYSGVLNAAQVSYLYSHPGEEAPPATLVPVDMELQLTLVRNQTLTGTDEFLCYPVVYANSPPALTDHIVVSPHQLFGGSVNGQNYSSSLNSLGDVLNECTNGWWKLFINSGDSSETIYAFKVSIVGVDTTWLTTATITTPANGGINVPTNSFLQWAGPTGFTGVEVEVHRNFIGEGTFLPGDATSWPSPPGLVPGTNLLDVTYESNNAPLLTFTIPVDANGNPTRNWSSTFSVQSTAHSQFVVVDAAAPTFIALSAPSFSGTNFNFQFSSQTGINYVIQYSTDFSQPNWQTYVSIAGDGTRKTAVVPLAVFNVAQRGFVRLIVQ